MISNNILMAYGFKIACYAYGILVYNLVYKLHEHAKIIIFTPFGETRMFEVDDTVKQGTTLGPILCSILREEYCETERCFYWRCNNFPNWIWR